jgi:hypothetical protein
MESLKPAARTADPARPAPAATIPDPRRWWALARPPAGHSALIPGPVRTAARWDAP